MISISVHLDKEKLPELNYATVSMNFGRFWIDITIRAQLPDDLKNIAPSLIYFHDENGSELFIRDIETACPPERNPLDLVRDIALSQETKYGHIACFGTEEAVEATPENISSAIQWCQKNQNFMKDGKV